MFANVLLAGLIASLGLLAGAGRAQGIYTCVDAKGRRLTSDRPILECIDREQKELTSSGTVKRTLKPSLTVEEQARAEEQERRQAEERLRIAEDRRRDRALLSRYPNKAAHDKERMDSLAQLGEVAKAANGRIQDRARVTAHFDEELAKLRPLGAQQAGMPAEARK